MRTGAARSQHDWLGHVQPTGLVVAPAKLDELGLIPLPQDQADNDEVVALLGPDRRSLPDAWAFLAGVLGWRADRVEGAPGGPALPDALTVSLRDGDTVLAATYAVPAAAGGEGWDLLVRVEAPGVTLDERGVLPGWEATAHQRFERLLRETGIGAGVLIGARATGRRDEAATEPEVRLVVAPKGETSGWIAWPLASLASVAGREMLAGLKLLLGPESLWGGPAQLRLPAVLDASRKAQAAVSERLSGQVLAALHELLRGLDAAAPELTRELAERDPHRLYEGLLTVLMRLIFLLYAEDRALMPSVTANGGAELYERGYSLGGLFVKLSDDEALYPDLMDERRGAWGRVLALFRLVARGAEGFTQRRGGRLFDEARFPFLLGKREPSDAERVLPVSDGCLLRVLERLMTLPNPRTGERERLSYRTLDVEQIGSVYETVMGFTVEVAAGPALAIRAGKNDKVPVFVDLARLLATPGGDRPKRLKEWTGRAKFGRGVEAALRAAGSVEELTAAFSGAGSPRSSAIDPRGSPRQEPTPPGSPILQPTDERRRTGSHYTPRSLTAPIVTHALEPAFERIGANATPAQVLDLKVCDPAVGSGAFLVEACRQLGARLVQAWEAHGDLKPPIPADEDDELHARRLVAQRCLYGVDRNPMALDLAKLSLWLATLARDHEFSFLDHALKSGDSLVGLSRAQVEAASWETNAPPNLWRLRVREDVERALQHREAIRAAPDDVALALQEAQYARVEQGLVTVRLIGDAVIGSFFAEAKPKARKAALADVALAAGGAAWDRLRTQAAGLAGGAHPVQPLHWEIEFPEVFARENPGFDAIVGNPPYSGGTHLDQAIGGRARAWIVEQLANNNRGIRGAVDLSAYFFLSANRLRRKCGAVAFVATNSIAQGDSRAVGLQAIIEDGAKIYRADTAKPWPGEAATHYCAIWLCDGEMGRQPILNDKTVAHITSALDAGDVGSREPLSLAVNKDMAFEGVKIAGTGFILDASEAHALLPSTVVRPFLIGNDVNSRVDQSPSRWIINFRDLPLDKDRDGQACARDYPGPLQIVEERVKPERLALSQTTAWNRGLTARWWQFGLWRPALVKASADLTHCLVISRVTAHHCFSRIRTDSVVFSDRLVVVASAEYSMFAILSSRVHELWAHRPGATTQGTTPNYSPTRAYMTFAFPEAVQSSATLDATGQVYDDHRAQVMIARNQGMTLTYNRFHDPHDQAADIVRLRELHADMD